MAEIRKIVKGNPLSNFRQAAPEAGGAFRFLAGAMEEAYNFLAPAAEKEMQARGADLGRELARQQIGDPAGAMTVSSMGGAADTLGLLREFEGFRETPYWDVNAHRAGYGSDTITDATGKVRKVTTGDRVSRDDAERDLSRRVSTEFEPIAIRAVGAERWASMSASQRAALTSITYNYGEVPSRIVGAVRSGDATAAAEAIRGLSGDNDGINAGRRKREADLFAGNVTMSSSGAETAPPTMLRDADGKLAARLYSPLAGPLLQAHNAAAGVAYQSDVMLKGMTDLMDLSNQFQMNPEGYQQAATAYVDDLVKAAPEMFRQDVRAGMEKVMQQRFLGMIEEKQRDTMKRANNSSAALAARWSDNLAQAIAGGNPDEIASARTELGSVLAARERLPGVAWTPEQSQNVILKAEQAAATLMKKAQDDQGKAWKDELSLVTEAAQNGRAADESILQNPAVQALLPDEWREAASSVMLRDEMPSFMRMTPAEQVAALTEMRAEPVTAEWEMDLYGAAEKAAQANAQAWEADPIKRAGEVLPQKPPALPDPEAVMQNPQSLTEALAARTAYAVGLKDQGYTDFLSFFTDEEATTFGALMGKDTPPEVKAMLAGAVVAAAGPNAVRVFQELKSDDPVTMHAGMLLARGGDPTVPVMAMTGQAKLDQGLVQAPRKATSIAAVDSNIASALAQLPNGTKAAGDTLKFATAIWAAGAPPGGEDEEAETLRMGAAMQQALGQSTNKRGQVTGGVQTVGGYPVLLAPGMPGERLNEALQSAFSDRSNLTLTQRLGMAAGYTPPSNADLWGDIGAPMLGGQPLKPSDFEFVQLTPEGGNKYRLALNIGGQMVDASTATGAPFIFDAAELIGMVK